MTVCINRRLSFNIYDSIVINYLGEKGAGKSSLAIHFGRLLGYDIETQLIYKDMNVRDFLQVWNDNIII